MVTNSEPLQRLRTVLRTIGNNSEMDKEDATDVALGLAKLMKSEDESSLICFLCKRKSSNRTKFLLHFRSHFRARKRIPDSDQDHSGTEEEEESLQRVPPNRRRGRLKKSTVLKSEEDIGGSCSSSDCLGDSESSDSDHDPNKGTKEDGSSVSLKDRLSLAEKQLDNNETEDLICLTCLKRFSNCQNLRRHLRLHISRDSITPDIDNDTSSGRYFCDWCPARFDNRSAARVHEDSHKNDQTKCYVCDKMYADRYSLRYHLRTHGIGRQIRCEYCNKSFSKPSRLDSHIKSHHNNIRDFKCSVCEKAFKTRLHLTNHFRQHSGERPFACEICHVRFRHKGSLLTHQRSHQGLRPYCCEICGKTFKEPSTLKAHSRVHTGDKPYKCGMCAKTFTQRAGLNYHKRLHSSEETTLAAPELSAGRVYTCELCHFSSNCEDSLNSHYRSLHNPSMTSNKLPSFDHLRSSSSSSSVPSPSTSPSSNLNEPFGNSSNVSNNHRIHTQTENHHPQHHGHQEQHHHHPAPLLTTPTPSSSPSSNGSASPHMDLLHPVEDYMQMDLLNGYTPGTTYAPSYHSSSNSPEDYSPTTVASSSYQIPQQQQYHSAAYNSYNNQLGAASYYDNNSYNNKYYSDHQYNNNALENVYYSQAHIHHHGHHAAQSGYCV